MAFSFGFSGDDIEEDPNDVVEQTQAPDAAGNNIPQPIPAQTHDLDGLLSTLPDKISYSTLSLTSPGGHTSHLSRRELFDVRLQLMAEDDDTNPTPLSGLTDTDLQTNVYEGGYKTWECSLDLVKYLLDRGPRKALDDMARVNHVIEMGCGSALPGALLLGYALREGLGLYFTLTDYNAEVLRLVTAPNLLLAWVGALGEERSAEVFGEAGNPLRDGEEHGDLYVTPELVKAFKDHLKEVGITLTFISGSWTPVPRLLELVPSTPDMNTFILGSETIYSPASLAAFTEAITELMKRVKMGKTIVAAKRVYFGVGGSVDGFREECAGRGCVGYEVEFEGLESDGVRRCLVEVQMC
ncbi:hypothetical protein P153DRAFT_398074 [Dothidotthia symphoricarpi CBS 119687]|uniref:protein-histidine N-methyltransferase n=1 Tax=Dothidotthia symphoricarpi CBS 119687 TaxID=1392245 RepID=A0A6A6ABZ9_9PLEO|nr:uncharacterized protein P153DRAFT_398074 [Dothidotthia symphoricarpi CBS 119687]KAF2128231.1 hypothetical protein P153DRAFT_398074 [Dothidotthia symphoricarpi CBS 119687]